VGRVVNNNVSTGAAKSDGLSELGAGDGHAAGSQRHVNVGASASNGRDINSLERSGSCERVGTAANARDDSVNQGRAADAGNRNRCGFSVQRQLFDTSGGEARGGCALQRDGERVSSASNVLDVESDGGIHAIHAKSNGF